MTRRNTDLDRLRLGRSELENHYIDELVAGRWTAASSCAGAQ